MSGDDRDAERASHAQLEAEIARHMDEIDAANNRWRTAKAECAAVAAEFRKVEAERDVALARIARLEAALRFYRWQEPTGASWREAGRVAAAALADTQSPSHRVLCQDCGRYPADLPSRLCPGCYAYREHTA